MRYHIMGKDPKKKSWWTETTTDSLVESLLTAKSLCKGWRGEFEIQVYDSELDKIVERFDYVKACK